MPTANPAITPEGNATPTAMLATAPRIRTMRPIRRSGRDTCGEAATTTAAAIAIRIAGYRAGGSDETIARMLSEPDTPASHATADPTTFTTFGLARSCSWTISPARVARSTSGS